MLIANWAFSESLREHQVKTGSETRKTIKNGFEAVEFLLQYLCCTAHFNVVSSLTDSTAAGSTS